jgi:transglycosylase-like protein with SLT domain/sporulation related protein
MLYRALMALLVALTAGSAVPDRAAAEASAGVAPAACRIVETAARSSHVPIGLLTRLVWTESRFQARAVSPKGAQGIAQFMPGTAAERGLLDPFDPEQAIPKAAQLIADLKRKFGNLGLAAAAYNGGADRVAGWLGGTATLPAETRAYVLAVTGRPAEDWAAERRQSGAAGADADSETCMAVTAALKTEEGAGAVPLAPWGVQLSGSFSKAAALAAFERARQRYARIIGAVRPMVIGSVLRSRGTRPFYRVMIPAETRAEANRVCDAIVAGGGACVALRS